MIVLWWILAIVNLVVIGLFTWFEVIVLMKLGESPSWIDVAVSALVFVGVVRLYPLAKRYDVMGRR
ncbi:MAG: hypothetical protein M3Z41_10340 [Candidatus Eremiobacteraeota bacterium]|nr:hypothetical protein [Candidatus Eremiobacteraeota bacterium]